MREGGGVEKLRPSYFATEGIERETDESKSLEFGSVPPARDVIFLHNSVRAECKESTGEKTFKR